MHSHYPLLLALKTRKSIQSPTPKPTCFCPHGQIPQEIQPRPSLLVPGITLAMTRPGTLGPISSPRAAPGWPVGVRRGKGKHPRSDESSGDGTSGAPPDLRFVRALALCVCKRKGRKWKTPQAKVTRPGDLWAILGWCLVHRSNRQHAASRISQLPFPSALRCSPSEIWDLLSPISPFLFIELYF